MQHFNSGDATRMEIFFGTINGSGNSADVDFSITDLTYINAGCAVELTILEAVSFYIFDKKL